MKKDETLIQRFEKVLKNRVELKTSPSTLPEKVLVDGFKFFDLSRSSKCDFKNFLQVMKMKFGITTISDAEIEEIFRLYSKDAPEINYKEFVNTIFESQVPFSITEKMNKSTTTQFPQLKFDLSKHEESIRKNIEYIIYKLRTSTISSFFRLYFDLFMIKSTDGGISQSSFHMSLKKLGIDISGEETQKIFLFLSGESQLMPLDKLFEHLLINYRDERIILVRNSFQRFDYTISQNVSLQLIRELFNPKNSLVVKEGKITADEMSNQFNELTNLYSKFNKNSFVINEQQFYHFFGFISGAIKEDKEFYQFMEYCFRYSELPKANLGKEHSSRVPFDKPHSVIDDLSLKNTALQDLISVLINQLNPKGDKAYIMFYKALRCSDYDSDGKIYEKEFEKSINELRIQFSKKQIQRLFDHFSLDKQTIDILNLMNLLVPHFDDEKSALIASLFERLAQTPSQSQPLSTGSNISYDQLINTFSVRQHPDFKKGLKADYEIRSEFEECIKTFLGLFSGTHLIISQQSLLRFFEFYGKNWDFEYLNSVVQLTFKVKMPAQKTDFNRPYGTNIDPEQWSNTPTQKSDKNNTGGGFKFYDEYSKKSDQKPRFYERSNLLTHEENQKQTESNYVPNDKDNILIHEEAFKKKPVDYKVAYPYFVNNQQNSSKKEEDGKNMQNVQNQQPVKKNEYRIVEPDLDNKSIISQKPRSHESEFNPNYKEKLEYGQGHLINSPEDGSIIAADKNFKFIADLNDKLEKTSVRQSVVPSNNFDFLQKRLQANFKASGKLTLFLQIEYEMTQQSDTKGNLDFEIFSYVLEKHDLLKNFKQQEITNLFISYAKEAEKVHVQKFANSTRGQATKKQEEVCIEVYDRITPPDEELTVVDLKNGFLPQKFKFGAYRTMSESKEMFNQIVSLFATLNLEIKSKNTFDLDDFLYMMDNFAFFIGSDDEFAKVVSTSFK